MWISVKDRLPERQEQWDGKTFVVVLFEANNYPQWSGRVQSMTPTYLLNYIGAKHDNPVIAGADSQARPIYLDIVTQSSGQITHWMPLPEPPK